MIENLRLYTESNIGFKIKTRGDCEKLSKLITITIDEEISYNTLRRFFGLDTKTKPNLKTLNILAKFNGFNSYIEFSSLFPKQFIWNLKETYYDLSNNDDPLELINFIKSINKINSDTLDIIILALRELILKNKIFTINKIFDLNILNPQNFNYSELLYFSNSIGLLLRKKQIDYLNFNSSKHFTNLVFTTFVDYSSLNKNYGDYAYKIYQSTKDNELKLFSGLLIELKNILNNKPPNNIYDSLVSTKTHPILLSRYMSIKIFCNPKENTVELLENYEKKYIKNKSIDYVYELIVISILTKNFVMMEWISKNFKQYKTRHEFYHDWHYHLLNLMILFLEIYKQPSKNNAYTQIDFIEKIKPRYSYGDFYIIFVCILKYHLKIEQELTIIKYKQVTKEIGYKFFSFKYLTNYFTN